MLHISFITNLAILFFMSKRLCNASSSECIQVQTDLSQTSSINISNWIHIFHDKVGIIFQVYGVFIEYLSQLPENERSRLTDLIYDDNCHLARFAIRKNLRTKNEVTKFFAENVRKNVDRFHFGNHIDRSDMIKDMKYTITVDTLFIQKLLIYLQSLSCLEQLVHWKLWP